MRLWLLGFVVLSLVLSPLLVHAGEKILVFTEDSNLYADEATLVAVYAHIQTRDYDKMSQTIKEMESKGKLVKAKRGDKAIFLGETEYLRFVLVRLPNRPGAWIAQEVSLERDFEDLLREKLEQIGKSTSPLRKRGE